MISGRFSPSFYPPNVRYPKAIVGKPTGKKYKNATYSVRFRSYVIFKKTTRILFLLPTSRKTVYDGFICTPPPYDSPWTRNEQFVLNNRFPKDRLVLFRPRRQVCPSETPSARGDLLFSSRRRRCCSGSAPSSSFGRFTVYTRVARAYREISHQ